MIQNAEKAGVILVVTAVIYSPHPHSLSEAIAHTRSARVRSGDGRESDRFEGRCALPRGTTASMCTDVVLAPFDHRHVCMRVRVCHLVISFEQGDLHVNFLGTTTYSPPPPPAPLISTFKPGVS